jgi:hypothetical protein
MANRPIYSGPLLQNGRRIHDKYNRLGTVRLAEKKDKGVRFFIDYDDGTSEPCREGEDPCVGRVDDEEAGQQSAAEAEAERRHRMRELTSQEARLEDGNSYVSIGGAQSWDGRQETAENPSFSAPGRQPTQPSPGQGQGGNQ